MIQRYTIHSRILNRDLTFSRPGSAYIYVNLHGEPGTLGQQLCEGGRLSGGTLTYRGAEQAQFEAVCRRWYRAYVRLTSSPACKPGDSQNRSLTSKAESDAY